MLTGQDAFFAGILARYGVTEDEYRVLYRAQGGACFICRKATGQSRRLGIDHNHLTGDVRAELCTGSRDPKTCNRLIAFYTRDALLRAAEVLSDDPPAQRVLQPMRRGEFIVPSLVGGEPFDIRDVRGVRAGQ